MKIHIVQRGETLWEIAKLYEVDFEELQRVNPQISSPDLIMPGMKIMIPQSSKTIVKQKEKKEKDLEIKPLKMKEDDYKEKITLNMTMPSLDSMELPIVDSIEEMEIKQKDEIKAHFDQEKIALNLKDNSKEKSAYHAKPYFYPPHCCYCCPCQHHYRQNYEIPSEYLGDRYQEPRYTGHLSGLYDYPHGPINNQPYSQTLPRASHNYYHPEIKDPKFPNSEENI